MYRQNTVIVRQDLFKKIQFYKMGSPNDSTVNKKGGKG